MAETDGRPLLRGWKEIAAYLGVSVRTAQRLAESDALPVHRTGQQKGGVCAYQSDLDAWVVRHDAPVKPDDATVAKQEEGVRQDLAGERLDLPSEHFGPAGEQPAKAEAVWSSATISPGRHRYLLIGVAALALALIGAVFVASRPSNSPAQEMGTTQPLPSEGRVNGPKIFRLRARFGDRPVADLMIPDGMRSSLLTAAKQTLYLEPQLRGRALRVVLYEYGQNQGNAGGLTVVGSAELKPSTEAGGLPVRFLVNGGWLELEWVQ